MAFVQPLPAQRRLFDRTCGRALSALTPRPRTTVRRSRTNTVARSQGDESDQSDGPKKPAVHISRRQAVQLLNSVLGTMTLGLLFKMREQFRLISPRAVLASFGFGLVPERAAVPPAIAASISADSARFREALKYVEMIDKRPPVECSDFAKSSDWINSRPLSLRNELKGKVVLLDFFSYCCINCQHVLPKLRELETKYGEDGTGGVVVVGVHSAKFTAERQTKNVAAAVERYDVKHPVINDEKMELWNAVGVSSWPTLALLGPKGNLLAVWSGERQEQDIDMVIAAALEYHSDSIDHRPLPPAPKRSSSLRRPSDSPLRYPGKIAFSEDGKTIFVADSGNNRIVQLDVNTRKVIRTFGRGEPGLIDSTDSAKAAFHSPQGIVEYDGILYVADTESHAVRAVDVATGKVETIGGNGEQGFDYAGGNVGKSQPLSSPWDVEVSNDVLYVAMAGTHQIWGLVLPAKDRRGSDSNPWTVFSGSGRELEKNSLTGRLAGWAQPSHLSAGAGGMLFVADSESSSVRAIDTNEGSHPTRTIAGGDGLLAENLFAFGDKEGRGSRARFQHPLAVCFDDRKNLLYVADSYNHRIKVIKESGEANVFCGNGSPGLRDGFANEAMFWEPAGLALSPDGESLYVADTNNFAIRVIDTDTRRTTTLDIASSLSVVSDNAEDKPLVFNRQRAIQIPCGPISPQARASFAVTLPDKSHFTPGATSRFQVNLRSPSSEADQMSLKITCLMKGSMMLSGRTGTFDVDLSSYSKEVGNAPSVEVEAVTYYCTEEDDVCRTEANIFDVKLAKGSVDSGPISHTIVPRVARQSKL